MTAAGLKTRVPGLALAILVAVFAYGIHYLPLPPFRIERGGEVFYPVSAALLAILLGMLVRNAWLHDAKTTSDGAKWITKRLIPVAIVLFGFGLNLQQLAQAGAMSALIATVSMLFALGAVYLLARALRLNRGTALLLGAGTGVCGNSAIVAVAPVIKADDRDLALSIGVVNLFGLVAMLACPLLGAAIGMGAVEFGVWAGATIHAVPQVVAAGIAYDPESGGVATMVKLVRVALLAPLVMVFAIVAARGQSDSNARPAHGLLPYARLVPWFVYGFAVATLIRSFVPLPDFELLGKQLDTVAVLKSVGKLLLVLAMAAIGLEIRMRELLKVGGSAVWVGLLSTAALLAFSFVLVRILL